MKKLYTILALTITFSMNSQMTDNSSGTSAGGDYSVAMGSDTTASGFASTAMGYSTTSSGEASTAMGWNTIASGDASTAMGYYSFASGNNSTSMGWNTTASGLNSTAIGDYTFASGENSTAMGYNTFANGSNSTAIGYQTTASGLNSTAMGYQTTASDYDSLVIGQYNLSGSSITNSDTSFSTENTAFVIGNGTNSSNRSDAFKVMFNGDATLAGNLSVNSDARLKANIISLGSTLAKILQIDGKSYTMRKDENKKQNRQMALLAYL